VPERPLAGEYHRHFWICFIACLDDFVIPFRAARLHNGPDALLNADIDAIAEGEKGIRNHCRAYEAAFMSFCLLVDLPQGRTVALTLCSFEFE
jgi:hypothetical protein